jgi:hypothetical protein
MEVPRFLCHEMALAGVLMEKLVSDEIRTSIFLDSGKAV